MQGKLMLYVDQFGGRFYAATIRELRSAIGGGKVAKMYVDGKDGKTYHVGYVVGQHWLTAFVPVRRPA